VRSLRSDNMRIYRSLSIFAILILLTAVAVAMNKEEEGGKLIARAVEISNIRAPGAPAFRVKATFQASNGRPADQGTYSEIWASREQWRRETGIAAFRRIEVGGRRKKWILDNSESVPSGVLTVLRSLNWDGMSASKLKIERVENKTLGGVRARCIEAKSDFSKEVYCVDPEDNTLLVHESLSKNSHDSYVYRDYKKFGDRLFPWSVQYRREGQAEVEITVSELTSEPSPEPSQFAPLSGALELTNCALKEITPPRQEWAPEPNFPSAEHSHNALVVLGMIVGSDGMTHHVQIARSGGTAFDMEAMRAVVRWRFKPAACSGEAVATEVSVEISFRRNF